MALAKLTMVLGLCTFIKSVNWVVLLIACGRVAGHVGVICNWAHVTSLSCAVNHASHDSGSYGNLDSIG